MVGGSIYTREFGKLYKSGLYLVLFPLNQLLSFNWHTTIMPPQWAQDQACSQLGVLIIQLHRCEGRPAEPPKLCLRLPKATLPRQLLTPSSHSAAYCPHQGYLCLPHSHVLSQSTHFAWSELLTAVQFWGF